MTVDTCGFMVQRDVRISDQATPPMDQSENRQESIRIAMLFLWGWNRRLVYVLALGGKSREQKDHGAGLFFNGGTRPGLDWD